MSADDPLGQAQALIDAARLKIEEALPQTSDWARDALKMLRAELAVAGRRLGNARRVIMGEKRAG